MHLHEYDWIETCSGWIRLCGCGFDPDAPAWRVLVTGSRKPSSAGMRLVHQKLTDELAYAGSLGLRMVVIEGQCPYGGVDAAAGSFAYRHSAKVDHDPFPANWQALGKRAGPYRNQQMVDRGADVCLAFPASGSRGTWDCVRRAKDAGIEVKVFEI